MVSVEEVEQLVAGSRRSWSMVPVQLEWEPRSKVIDCQPDPEMVTVEERVELKDASVVRRQKSWADLLLQLLWM
jgi:hypothetical protein